MRRATGDEKRSAVAATSGGDGGFGRRNGIETGGGGGENAGVPNVGRCEHRRSDGHGRFGPALRVRRLHRRR
jgi:hypothetical protein